MVSTYKPSWRGHLKAPQLVQKEKARKSNDTVTRDHSRGRCQDQSGSGAREVGERGI